MSPKSLINKKEAICRWSVKKQPGKFPEILQENTSDANLSQ